MASEAANRENLFVQKKKGKQKKYKAYLGRYTRERPVSTDTDLAHNHREGHSCKSCSSTPQKNKKNNPSTPARVWIIGGIIGRAVVSGVAAAAVPKHHVHRVHNVAHLRLLLADDGLEACHLALEVRVALLAHALATVGRVEDYAALAAHGALPEAPPICKMSVSWHISTCIATALVH